VIANDERGNKNNQKVNVVQTTLLKLPDKKMIIRACFYEDTAGKKVENITNTGRW